MSNILFWSNTMRINDWDTICFEAGEKITLSNKKEISFEELREGDSVQAYDIEKNEIVSAKVLAISKKIVNKTLHVYLSNNEIIKATPEHIHWINGNWLELKEGKIGDWLINEKNEKVYIIKIEEDNTKKFVYNASIEKYHNYFVNGVLAHNKCGNLEIINGQIIDERTGKLASKEIIAEEIYLTWNENENNYMATDMLIRKSNLRLTHIQEHDTIEVSLSGLNQCFKKSRN